jgi:hypothetical protein
MTSASHHFASCCSRTVLPVPKPPGTAAVLPRATGKSKSSTRCPVDSASVPSSRSRAGRGWRTGQDVRSGTSIPATLATAPSGGHGPSRTAVTVPLSRGGTMTRCSTVPAASMIPKQSPGATWSPAWTAGRQDHSRSRPLWDVVPGASQVGAPASGRSSPSKTPPSNPGPSGTDSGSPSEPAGSPGRSPPVYSYA